jgi:hypothetical protein
MQVISDHSGVIGELHTLTTAEIISSLNSYLNTPPQADALDHDPPSFTLRLPKLRAATSQKKSVKPTSELTGWTAVTHQELIQEEDTQRRHGLLREGEVEKCSVCLCSFEAEDEGNIVRLGKCIGHFFHVDCIEQCRGATDFLKCPICGVIYGVMTGDMPEGSMTVTLYSRRLMTCEGFEDYDTIVLFYAFPNGRLPCGRYYRGTRRTAYLPNTSEGREVLRLLTVGFERRLIFTVGSSITTGREDVVIWNGIHFKTSLDGGTACYGYPDQTYFFRVKEELAAKGVLDLTEED